jgi:RND family efflux transporter MFP subunit
MRRAGFYGIDCACEADGWRLQCPRARVLVWRNRQQARGTQSGNQGMEGCFDTCRIGIISAHPSGNTGGYLNQMTKNTVALLLCMCPIMQAIAAEFDCVIEPKQVLEIRSPLEGLVMKVNADRGERVHKGQEVAVIDTSVDRAQAAIDKFRSELEGAVRAAESKVAMTTKKLERAQELVRQNYISAQARDEALNEKQLAEAELLVARDNRKLADLEHSRQMAIINLKSIRSPINGVVMERILNPGELAEAGVGRKPILKLAELDVLYVEVLLPAEAFGQVKPGTMVEVTPEIPAGTQHKAKVKLIDGVLDAASGTFGVRLELPNPQFKLPAGVRCKANFTGVTAKSSARASSAAREQDASRLKPAPAITPAR